MIIHGSFLKPPWPHQGGDRNLGGAVTAIDEKVSPGHEFRRVTGEEDDGAL